MGLKNYLFILKSSSFWNSKVTFVYAGVAVGIETILGTITAFLLNTETIMAKICRPFLLLPLMIAPLITTLI